MRSLQMCNLAREKCVARKFTMQSAKQFYSARLVSFPDVGDREKDSRKGSEIVSVIGGSLKISDPALLVSRQATHPKNPSNRRRHASDDVLAKARCQQSVVAIVTDRKQLRGRDRSLLCKMQ